MSDLIIGLVVVGSASAGMFLLALKWTRRNPRRRCLLLGLLTFMSIIGYTVTLWDTVQLAHLLPYSNLLVIGNWFPPAAAFLAGLVWHGVSGSVVRRSMSVAALGGVSVYSLFHPLLGEAPRCGDRWSDEGVCLQTTDATCSAACAATLLGMYGIDATEQEMAELCLTRDGTRWQGLYRGLKHKTAGTQWDVEVLDCKLGDLRFQIDDPVIAAVGIDGETRDASFYESECGLTPRSGHSIIVTGFSRAGWARVIDPHPDYVLETWDPEMLHDLWKGPVLRIVPREDAVLSDIYARIASITRP